MVNTAVRKTIFLILFTFFSVVSSAQSGWYEKESGHFRLIYKSEHSFFADHIINSAEKSLKILGEIFNYIPEEKIVINTYDINDYGFATATTVPENFIRLEIEPFEPGYEIVPYNERIQWILNHELVHIVLNDQATTFESISRFLFSKVSPEQIQPMTVLYSLLSNYSRYTSRWHQESPAVFLETWLSGGFGRASGSFDEMYFRSMVYEEKSFPCPFEMDAITSHNSFLLESLFYIYGGRFASFLSAKYGSEKLIQWFKINRSDFYPSIQGKFEDTFGANFYDEWDQFIDQEKMFQRKNIEKITKAPLTKIKYLLNNPVGWITTPFITPSGDLIFGTHQPHQLAAVKKLNISEKTLTEITTLPSPSMYQVASLAYDSIRNFLYYTTNNNQLYRDVWVYDMKSGEKKELFPDLRIGHMSVCALTGDFWGIQHTGGKTNLILSEYPYNRIETLYRMNFPDEIIQLSVTPDGSRLAIVIHRGNGNQELVVVSTDELRYSDNFNPALISDSGVPENPSWSGKGEFLFWNAYENGVSNIYRMETSTLRTESLSNTVRGLFRPVMLNRDYILAFEFTSEGFIPSVILNRPAQKLYAISYLGQEVLNRNPSLSSLSVPEEIDSVAALKIIQEVRYNGLSNLSIQAFIPVVTGFQKQKVLGFYTRISDPLLNHDITAEFGYSPFNENPLGPKYHMKLKYEYMKRIEVGVDYNATDFYDLFNKRKRGTIGTKVRAGYINYWLYDNPHKIKQTTEIALYTDYQFINDNLVKVSEPDFAVAQSVWSSRNLRRTIGSSDYEWGDEISATAMVFGADPKNQSYAGGVHLEWDKYALYIADHNVFHYKLSGGYHFKNDRLQQARFYFGGFGNREIENTDVKQYRSVFRFPGLPIYSLDADQFLKLFIENSFPPLRFKRAGFGQHYISHIDFAVYSNALLLRSYNNSEWVNAGAQVNILLKHWFNLESTFSAGIAKAWSKNYSDWEWFLSYKLLKN